MTLQSEIVKKVDIPASLPDLADMAGLEGSILLKDVNAGAESILVEGDLLWRGYFPVAGDTDEVECLWEGAEYFSQEVPIGDFRGQEGFRLDPAVLSVRADELAQDSCHLVFNIRWQEGGVEEDFAMPEPPAWPEQPPVVEVAVPVESVRVVDDVVAEEIVTGTFEQELEQIEENWREKWESLKASTMAAPEEATKREEAIAAEPEKQISPAVIAAAEEAPPAAPEIPAREELSQAREELSQELSPTSEEDGSRVNTTMFNQSPPYCLKYYRVQEGEDLNVIAERLSASINKIKEINSLAPDEDGLGVKVDPGQLLRVPTA